VPRFMHRRVRQFTVGDFSFKNHILVLKTEEEAEAFRATAIGLPPKDRAAIVEMPEEDTPPTPLRKPRTVRGPMNTDDASDEKADKTPKSTNKGDGTKVIRGSEATNHNPLKDGGRKETIGDSTA
jgi:hypothetical protein